jgi:hypothetical protein
MSGGELAALPENEAADIVRPKLRAANLSRPEGTKARRGVAAVEGAKALAMPAFDAPDAIQSQVMVG